MAGVEGSVYFGMPALTAVEFPPVRLSFLAEIAAAVLVLTADALADTVYGRPGDLLTGHSTPPDDCCDYVSVVWSGLRPAIPATTAQPAQYSTDRCAPVAYAGELAITVARSGAPTLTRNRRNMLPTPQEKQTHAEAMMEDAVCLMYRVMPAIPQAIRDLVPFTWLHPPLWTAGRLTPFDQGACAGWLAAGALSLPQPVPGPL